jgi:L-fuculose-phosphate aldolase
VEASNPRSDLLTALRILEANGVIDFNGHVSVRHASGCLINRGRSVRSRLTDADIVSSDCDGKPVLGEDAPPREIPIHSELYRRRPDVGAVVHGHPSWSTILSSTGRPYRPVFPQGALLGSVPVFLSPLSINTPELGRQVAELMSNGSAILLRSHGVVVVGPDLRTATIRALYLEDNARRQCLSAPLGGAYEFSEEEIAACRSNLDKPDLFAKAWDYYALKLGR